VFDAELAEEVLRAHARAGQSVTYAALLEALGFRFSRPKMRQLCRLLGDIDATARGRGEPELAVLVVRQSDGLPGQGWWTSGGAEGYRGPWEGPRAKAHVAKLQKRAFAYWSRR
jgi:hypothetical protein